MGGVVGVEDVGRQEQLTGATGADGLDDIGSDGRGDEAQLDLGEGEARALDRHGHVAGGDDAGSAAHGRAFDQRHRQGRHVVQRLQHLRQAHGVVAVVGLGPAGGVAHPVQVSARAEGAARAADEDHAHPVRALQCLERFIEGGDGGRVEGVALLGTVDGHEDHARRQGVDLDQLIVRVRRRIGDEGMGDGVHLGRLGVGDVQGVQVFFGRLLVGHGRLLQASTPEMSSFSPRGRRWLAEQAG
ncbi:hypothetical protein D3C72_1315560 [compost metagenome]